MMGAGIEELSRGSFDHETALEALEFMAIPAAELLLSPFAAFRNIQKARFMNNLDASLNRSGDTVAFRDFKWQEEAAKAIGFRIGDVARLPYFQAVYPLLHTG